MHDMCRQEVGSLIINNVGLYSLASHRLFLVPFIHSRSKFGAFASHFNLYVFYDLNNEIEDARHYSFCQHLQRYIKHKH